MTTDPRLIVLGSLILFVCGMLAGSVLQLILQLVRGCL